jgi:predicted acyltransferase
MSTEVQQPAIQVSTPLPASGKPRLTSLDVFRGMTIAAMILVNDAGDWGHVYWPLEHAEWHGWTPTDLIFPFFLFIVGISMVLSFDSRQAKGSTRGQLLLHSLKRSVLIFLIGKLIAGYPHYDLHTLRIPGVLERIAVVYLIASAMVLYLGHKARIAVTAALLLGYWALLKWVPVPGFGAGNLTMDGNLAGYIDRSLMYNHLWIAHRFDPEGLLSTLPAIGTCLLGVFTGEWMRGKSSAQLLRGLLVGAVIGLALGKIWNFWFPINKNLWSSSFVLFTAGFGLALFALCYWLVDIRGWKKLGQPFVWYGVNPLAIYAMAGLLAHASAEHHIRGERAKDFIYGHFYQHLFASPYLNSMAYGLSYVLLFWIIAWVLYRNKIFIRV